MKEENKGASNKWSRIFRKKWFFPAVYLTVAALLLSVVVWYQNLDNQMPDAMDEQEEQESEDYVPTLDDEDAEPVVDQQENIEMPVVDQDQAEIVTKFYDYNAEQEDQENALVLYNNRFYQSTGLDIASADAETFDVVASLSGTVTEVKEDPLLGNVVSMSHDNDVMTYYASLGEVEVQAGADVEQGDLIGTAGNNLFGQDNGTHVHFELRKDGNEVNPESFFNQPVASLDSVTEEESEASEESEATEEESEATEEEDTGEDEDADSEDEESDVEDDDLDEETTDSSDMSEGA
ncbi:stage II sporulation protein Q [Virgibacillus natechei]|uniref:Stage II sporulation protein Q n=1 Tax=Virgibacillus natechei TaxID=1216297 RepID=A0ABS4IL49_9BACI|nr:M23 family metallopeptidase [Virgibacillus natechei]MBP1971687.1 stage II sporulation protein Q [Virgibacillus natechei]UZD12576.1 M23 family metallopeptidase [Virgibacillus natechei]